MILLPGHRSALPFLLLLAGRPSLASTTTACYSLDGSKQSGSTPCSSTGDSQCCITPGGICLSNGHCLHYSQPIGLFRGLCTDPTWSSEGCPQRGCAGDDSSTLLFDYWMSNSTTTMYCCHAANPAATDEASACLDGSAPFAVPVGTPLVGFAGLSNAEIVSSSTSGPPWAAAPTASSSSSNAGAAEATGSCGSGLEVCRAQREQAVTAAGGVGAGVGVVAAGLLAWAVWERRKRLAWRRDYGAPGWKNGSGSISPAGQRSNVQSGYAQVSSHVSQHPPVPPREMPDVVPAAVEMAGF